MTVSHFINNGAITGIYLGGVVGYSTRSAKITIAISHSTNYGVLSHGAGIGGFIGTLKKITQVTLKALCQHFSTASTRAM